MIAWNTLTHSQLSQIAFNHLPDDVRESIQAYLPDIYRGAVAPDLYLQDWENHDLNIHGNETEQLAAITRITELYESIKNNLSSSNRDLSLAAYEMGLLSHYLADINQPLHTDELAQEDLLHSNYETDVLLWFDNFLFTEKGIRYRNDPKQMVIDSAEQANRFYYPIYSSYLNKVDSTNNGFNNTQGITWINIQRAIEDIRDTWLTLLLQNDSPQKNIAISVNKKIYYPGESIQIQLSTLLAKNYEVRTDLYIAVSFPSGEFLFLNKESKFVPDKIPRYQNWLIKNTDIEIFNTLLRPEDILGEYKLYALLVKPDHKLEDITNWLSDIATIQIQIDPLNEFSLNELNNEIYLFPAIDPDSKSMTTLPLQRWDIMFLGELDGSDYNVFIPGNYDHILTYLGRNKYGIPYAAEMTYSNEYKIVDFRLVRLPEFENTVVASDNLELSILTKPLWQYNKRWAKRLIPAELKKLVNNEKILLYTIEADWLNRFQYQLEYHWSGDFNDRNIYLVDDGLLNGASCTDYWLTLFENISGVCISNARINAKELEYYYLNDPLVAQSPIPDSLNPFPFSLTSKDLIETFNFKLIDPPAHRFSCNAQVETGVPIPSRLINSPQLENITPTLSINTWP
ncbi:MAG: zinc dependent phospholipase C family protein [Pseudomonadota bacterium]